MVILRTVTDQTDPKTWEETSWGRPDPIKGPSDCMGHCPLCGIQLYSTMHYVCNDPNCPTFTRICW